MEITEPKIVMSRDGSETGLIKGKRQCQMEGCRGMRIITLWPNGAKTMPCTKGMKMEGDQWRII